MVDASGGLEARPMKMLAFAVLLVVLLTVAAACDSNTSNQESGGDTGGPVSGQLEDVDGGTFNNVTAAELRSMLEEKDFVLVNTHIPYEGHIEGTDLFIPYDEVEQLLGELPAAADEKIVVYCRSGSMSAIAAKTLVGLGYTNVWNLDGGMIAWDEAGYPLARTRQ
jgi:rhodanese-related sulfurtransferase